VHQKFHDDESLRTCTKCGHIMPVPPP
jgi:hypothetical protein